MRNFISNHYQNSNGERFNMDLINREYDDSLVDYVVASCKSLEVLEYIEFLDYRFIEDETQIDMRNYYRSRKENDISKLKYREMKDSRFGELIARFRVTFNDETEIVEKRFLIPSADEQGYYTIKGNKYFMLYQLVDSSTYTQAQGLTLKSLMPVKVSMSNIREEATDKQMYEAPGFHIMLFKTNFNIFQLYFAKFGVLRTLEYFNLHKIITFSTPGSESPESLCFNISSKLQIEVNRDFFERYSYVRSMTLMIKPLLSNRVTPELLDDTTYWVGKLGIARNSGTTYDEFARGRSTLTFFERMIDETTKKILKLSPANKKDVYSVVRWMTQNYTDLRKKDNLDLSNKRLRCNEYIASLVTEEFSKKLSRIISLGNKVKTIKKIKEIFSVPGDILLQQLHRSGILRFDDRINDMTFFSKLKYTIKGPNSLGGKNTKMIAAKYKGLHPSYIGLIDTNVCGTSDPGSSGMITPFAKTTGLYFDGNNEPEDGVFDLRKDISEKELKTNLTYSGLYIDLYANCQSNEEIMKLETAFHNLSKDVTMKYTREVQ